MEHFRNDVTLILSEDEQRYIDSRVHDVDKSASRSRWIYGATSVISLLIFSIAYNEYFSWSRKMALKLKESPFDEESWVDQLRLLMMQDWVSALHFDLPYVGGKFGASDAGIIGGLILFLASVWCYYSARRENHQVYFLIKDFKEFDFSENARFYLCNQLFSTQLFVHGEFRAYSAESIRQKETGRTVVHNGGHPLKTTDRLMHRLLGFAMWLIFLTPVFALSMIFVVDILTLLEPSPIRKSSDSLYTIVCGNASWWNCRDGELIFRIGSSFALLVLVSRVMWCARRFQRGTESMVHFTQEWKKPVLDRLNARNRARGSRSSQRL